MKILTGTAIREADRFTIEHEPIESLALMERASEAIAQWICNHISQDVPLLFVVGKGNNGGDGLAVARMLHKVGSVSYTHLTPGASAEPIKAISMLRHPTYCIKRPLFWSIRTPFPNPSGPSSDCNGVEPYRFLQPFVTAI